MDLRAFWLLTKISKGNRGEQIGVNPKKTVFNIDSSKKGISLCAGGNEILLWGVKLNVFVHQKKQKPEIELKTDGIHLFCAKTDDRPNIAKQLDFFCRRLLLEESKKLLEYWKDCIGITFDVCINIRKMKARWGSCLPEARKIILNSQLVEKPHACLSYVILHELLHFFEANHGARFYKLLSSYKPDWRSQRAMLNES